MSGESVIEFTGFIKACRLFRENRLAEAEAVCTNLLRKNPLDQATWALKMQCLSDSTYVDELENEDMGLAETFLDQNVIAPNARPGTSFARPKTSAKGVNPILRPTTNAGRPLSGVVRPQSSFKSGSMDQAVRTARTAKTARAVSSTSARNMRLGTASMAAGADGEFVNLARLNIDKYAADPQVNRQLFEYVFYYLNDIRVAHQIAGTASKAAGFEDYYWKNQLAKCYLRLGMLQDATKQLQSSLEQKKLIETFALLSKAYNRVDQPMAALKTYSAGLEVFPENVTMLTGMARVQEALGEYDESVKLYKRVLDAESNNIEAIACVATTYYYGGKPELAMRYYRRILQMGVSSPELFLNIGLCCMAAQQFDFALSSILRAQSTMTDDVAADVWYNIGQILVDIGDLVSAARSFRIALSHDPDHSESLVNLGILKHREGKIDEARSLYSSATSKNPYMFEGNYNLGLVSFTQGKYHECRELIEKALAAFPEHEHCKKILNHLKPLYESI
ncbi:Tetratricopeptide repeat protein 8 [Caenorhabditis elegans]|uniref:Tetratricopeptide repeat protein 8 n=1 Tax=Caenorhabditis elegans TaxID=6239 RepID=TTC8_CAEEL|nr:Tetratricopeptide repeat protein 8 [Caenorhabditis elegans]Q23049.2 RecName: Full=Tetratricopeptide repeat protein 8; AltName: Full=Bardet-Biedl syndrome 8 protein homolog [Caenorhabditis elegans]CCD74239.1 Tetratricopeptide repeat protein 8 [Caenorhabditis elegans]|eukprot:NP_504711.2 Tetratricopeptide repeat protein 8 [Caenorhabditis elegans]